MVYGAKLRGERSPPTWTTKNRQHADARMTTAVGDTFYMHTYRFSVFLFGRQNAFHTDKLSPVFAPVTITTRPGEQHDKQIGRARGWRQSGKFLYFVGKLGPLVSLNCCIPACTGSGARAMYQA